MWPAVIATKRRIVSENGFVKIPINSTGKMTQRKYNGTPGVQKICDQYALLPFTLVIINVNTANTNVTAILPVRFPAPGKSPSKISKEYKEEKGQHVRQELFVMMPNIWFHDFIANKNNNGFKKRLDSLWGFAFIFIVSFCHRHKYQQQNGSIYEQHRHIFGD